MTISLDRFTRPATVYSHQFGAHRVTYLPDGVALVEPRAWLPAADEEMWLDHTHLINPDGYLVASVGALMIEIDHHTMLIDTGVGPLALPTPFGLLRGGQLLESLAAVDKSSDDIDLIALTHLHLDHLGWLWQSAPGQSASPFAHAEVLVGAVEWSHPELANTDGVANEMLDVFASQVHTITDGQTILPGVEAIATPGHTLGHIAYSIGSGGRRLLAFGDAIASPIQISHPHLTSASDDDPVRSVTTARHLINELSRDDTTGFGLHFADVQLGHVTQTSLGRRWIAENSR
ncbi:MBL fold metallo-hydrolase [Nocardia iowensis]|uniref:MBL fold metallo-hydrolase n=1 Tax=Nocardia iowensis TaxID=204891 RepID=A0ABX8RY52_NOCIO|nr:MBL fold metallo-hydrolase [Nocardia iowensis]QXN94604.1 MBL fold metallo-hydrolase [Nocardia iowensis]